MEKTLTRARPAPQWTSTAATIAVVGSIAFVVLVGLLHVIESNFDPTWRFISEYELGRYGFLMHLAFVALATSLAATAVSLWSQARTKLGYIGLAGFVLAAIGILMAGIFTTDPITTPQNAMDFSGNMHVLGAALDYSPVAMLLLSISLWRKQAWRSMRSWMFVAAGLSLGLMFAFIAALPKNNVYHKGVYAGLIGRLLLISYTLWIIPMCRHIQALRRT
ncbi:MAG TPA: DUF998 domain-containing protein [Candidatus Saccharimonadia bacterium]|nr:DUF998 domain-containing protein [Candidatus Saccharimonadia bacterium]